MKSFHVLCMMFNNPNSKLHTAPSLMEVSRLPGSSGSYRVWWGQWWRTPVWDPWLCLLLGAFELTGGEKTLPLVERKSCSSLLCAFCLYHTVTVSWRDFPDFFLGFSEWLTNFPEGALCMIFTLVIDIHLGRWHHGQLWSLMQCLLP